MDSNDEKLIESCLNGEIEAFSQLVEKYQDRLCRSLYRMTGSTHDSSEIAQEAFVMAYQKLDTFKGNSKFYSWLYRIAFNTFVSQKRKKTRIKGSLDSIREASGEEPVDEHPDASPEHRMHQTENQKLVQEALNSLPEEFREVLVMKEMDGLKYDEIAEIVGCPVGTVRSRIHRARTELRSRLESLLDPEDLQS